MERTPFLNLCHIGRYAAGDFDEVIPSEPENGVGRSRRGPDHVKVFQVLIKDDDGHHLVADGSSTNSASADFTFPPKAALTFFSSTRLTPEAITRTGFRSFTVLSMMDLAICATVQPTAAAASAEVFVLCSNSTTLNFGPSAACTRRAAGWVAGFTRASFLP
jgi:hypothetical protein